MPPEETGLWSTHRAQTWCACAELVRAHARLVPTHPQHARASRMLINVCTAHLRGIRGLIRDNERLSHLDCLRRAGTRTHEVQQMLNVFPATCTCTTRMWAGTHECPDAVETNACTYRSSNAAPLLGENHPTCCVLASPLLMNPSNTLDSSTRYTNSARNHDYESLLPWGCV